MKKRTLPAAGIMLMLAGGVVSGCIDDKYDLSDIDTTTELKVTDLTVPVEFDDVYLDQIIDVNEDDPDAILKIREINGSKWFVLEKSGTFDAKTSHIDKIHAPAPADVQSTVVPLSLASQGAQGAPAAAPVQFAVPGFGTDFTYRVGRDGNPQVNKSVRTLCRVSLDENDPLHLTMTFHSTALAGKTSHIELRNLVLDVPACIDAEYRGTHAAGGRLTIPSASSTGTSIPVDLTITGIDFTKKLGAGGMAVENGCFDFSDHIGVISADFIVTPQAGFNLSEPGAIDLTTDYVLSKFTVDSFSGEFDYLVDVDSIDPIEITDLPGFLAGEETDLTLVEPVVMLTVNNPLAPYGLGCAAGISLSAIGDNGTPRKTCELEEFRIAASDINNIVLSDSENIPGWFGGMTPAGATYTRYPGLGGVLSGKGIPSRIGIEYASTLYPQPEVKGFADNFPLGIELAQIHGEYRFIAPLSLASGSKIVYATTEDGWNDEDVDAIAISSLKVHARMSTDIPAGTRVIVRPVDVQGKHIPLTNEADAYAVLPANAADYELNFELLGDIRHLDGVYIEATVDDFSGNPLLPAQTIRISDLRATISGKYVKEL